MAASPAVIELQRFPPVCLQLFSSDACARHFRRYRALDVVFRGLKTKLPRTLAQRDRGEFESRELILLEIDRENKNANRFRLHRNAPGREADLPDEVRNAARSFFTTALDGKC